MRLKNTLVILVIMVGLTVFHFVFKPMYAEGQDNQDLVKFAAVFKGENILLNEWSFYAREHLVNVKSTEAMKEYVQELKKKFPDWNWSESNNSQRWEVTATSPATDHQQEMLQVLATHTIQPEDAYIVYRVSGTKWDQQSASFFTSFQYKKRLFDIFREKPTIFSCVKGKFSGKINTSLPQTVNHLLAIFNAKKVEALNEKNFLSVTAHSPLFAESVDNRNLQIGIRKGGLGADTTIVIGTPIITVEY